jgi:hypothetical protein
LKVNDFSCHAIGDIRLVYNEMTLAPVPKTGEMNLMKYYEDATVNMKYTRSIASESDVKNLIYISKRR